MVERCPDKTEVHGSIPCTRTMNPRERGELQPDLEVAQKAEAAKLEAEKVLRLFTELRGLDDVDTIEIPATTEEAQEYIRKLEILKEGKLVPLLAQEKDHVFERVDAYIEKLQTVGQSRVVKMGERNEDISLAA